MSDQPNGSEEPFANAVLRNFLDVFVTPEVERRVAAGELAAPVTLRAAQVVFFADGRANQIRINEEVRAKIRVELNVSKGVGDDVRWSEIRALNDVELAEDEDPDAAHATIIRVAGEWCIAFDFRYNRDRAQRHLAVGVEFLAAAREALAHGRLAVFVDTLFSGAELIAKSMLLLSPDPALTKSKTHGMVHGRLNRWAKLGNVEPPDFTPVFNRLPDLRRRARYLHGDVTLAPDEAEAMIECVSQAAALVRARIGRRPALPAALDEALGA